MKKLFFARIALLRGARPLAVIQHTVSGSAYGSNHSSAPRTASQIHHFFRLCDDV